MGHLRRFLRRLINVIRPGREEAGLERELASHLVLLEDEYRRRGLSADEARRSARLALGGVDQAKERHRDARSFRWFDDTRRDAVYAIRSLRRTPVFALTAALVLGLGIGANATVFTIVNTLLLQPLPFERADDIVQVRRRTPLGSSGSFPMHDYLALTTQRGAALGAGDSRRLQCRSLHPDDGRRRGADHRMPRQRGVLRGARRLAGARPTVHERR